ncbi:MAG: D-alanyl-D-alanine carboxypeptidase family protein [Oscillospiraceae bacterium]
MKKQFLAFFAALALLATPVLAAESAVIAPPPVQPAESAVIAPAPVQAGGAILMEKETGRVLYEQDAHKKLEPASVTKVMTLLLVMEALDDGRLKLDDLVTVSANAAGMGGSQVYLKEGEQFSARELLKAVAVVSGNDASVALAEHLAGSEAAFVARMNARARELGMADTCFMNCTGLPAAGHLTSAYDIALMSRALILHHPGIREFTTIWMDSIRDGAFQLANTNKLIRFYPGATGLKTGSTDSAQYCLSATAEKDGMELIAVILKSPSSPIRFDAAKSLLNFGFAGYTVVDALPQQALPPMEVLLGECATVQPLLARSSRVLVEKTMVDKVTCSVTLAPCPEAPVEQGQILGRMRVCVDGVLQEELPIVAAEAVPRLSLPAIFGRFLKGLFMGS